MEEKERLTIFVGYDKDGILSEYVLYYIKKMADLGDVILVYDSDIQPDEAKKAKGIALHQILGRHGEYDFGSYKRGYLWAKEQGILDRYDTLVFCNDSVFGPFHDLVPIFERFEQDPDTDFWGMYKVVQKIHHIQGYFIAFSSRVFRSEVFDKFVSSMGETDRGRVVKQCEFGLSKTLHDAGFKSKGLFEGRKYSARNNDALRIILEGFPFMKTKLFVPNPKKGGLDCDSIYRYKKVIKKVCPEYDLAWIEDYVLRFVPQKKYRQMMRFSWFRTNLKSKYIYDHRITGSGKRLIKVFRIPVYNRRLSPPKP